MVYYMCNVGRAVFVILNKGAQCSYFQWRISGQKYPILALKCKLLQT